jgi:hypothetical protein
VRLEGLGQLKNPVTSSGIEPATFQERLNDGFSDGVDGPSGSIKAGIFSASSFNWHEIFEKREHMSMLVDP